MGIGVPAACRFRNSSRASICCTVKRELSSMTSRSPNFPNHSVWSTIREPSFGTTRWNCSMYVFAFAMTSSWERVGRVSSLSVGSPIWVVQSPTMSTISWPHCDSFLNFRSGIAWPR